MAYDSHIAGLYQLFTHTNILHNFIIRIVHMKIKKKKKGVYLALARYTPNKL